MTATRREREQAGTAGPTQDRLLDGCVILRQPATGYRVAVDPVLLAAAAPVRPGEGVLDLGCGVGAVALSLLQRVPGARVTGLERQGDLVELARANSAANGRDDTFQVLQGDLLDPPESLRGASFDHVLANPPYLPASRGSASPNAGRAAANVEEGPGLADWIGAGLRLLRPKGRITLIHRADRLDELLAALAGRAGDVAVLPLWPGEGKPARRVIVSARKGVAGPARLLPGLLLHEAGGDFTPAAQAVLRDGAALELGV